MMSSSNSAHTNRNSQLRIGKTLENLKQRVFQESYGMLESSEQRTQGTFVDSEGPPHSKILFVSDSPSAEEGTIGIYGYYDALMMEKGLCIAGTKLSKTSHTVLFKLRDPQWDASRAVMSVVQSMSRFLAEEIDLRKPEVVVCVSPIAHMLCRSSFSVGFVMKQHTPESGNVLEPDPRYMATVSKSGEKSGCLITPGGYSCHLCAIDLTSRYANAPHSSWASEKIVQSFRELSDLLTLPPIKVYDIPSMEKLEKKKLLAGDDIIYHSLWVQDPSAGRALMSRFGTRISSAASIEEDVSDALAGSLDFCLLQASYASDTNTFRLHGRTARGSSVCLSTHTPSFHFYLKPVLVATCVLVDRWKQALAGDRQQLPFLEDTVRERMKAIVRSKRGKVPEPMTRLACSFHLEIVNKKSYYKLRSATSPFLKVTYYYATSGRMLAQALRESMDSCMEPPAPGQPPVPFARAYELDVPPLQSFYYDREVYTGRWCRVSRPGLTACGGRNVGDEWSSDISLSAPFSAVGPGDPSRNDACPIRILYFDCEMPTMGTFPTPERNPIVSICGVMQTHDSGTMFESTRDPSDPEGIKTVGTGRSNAEDRVVFSLGTCDPILSQQFEKCDPIPNPPRPPGHPTPEARPPSQFGVTTTLLARSVRDEEEQGCLNGYARHVYQWCQFGQALNGWTVLVGTERAAWALGISGAGALQGVRAYCATLAQYKWSAASSHVGDPDVACSAWRDPALGILEACRASPFFGPGPVDIREFRSAAEGGLGSGGESNAARPAAMSQEEWEVAAGTIQGRWHLFHRDARVFSFGTESDMIAAFLMYVQQTDPDMLSGYNCKRFDARYLLSRARLYGLSVPGFSPGVITIGRRRCADTEVSESKFYSKAQGERVVCNIGADGRAMLDMLEYFMREKKMGDYTLQSVSNEILRDGKDAVPYSAIDSLFINNRQRLHKYCLKDAELCMRLLNMTNMLYFSLELSKLTGILTIEELYSKGQQARVIGILRRTMNRFGPSLIIPTHEKARGTGDKGQPPTPAPTSSEGVGRQTKPGGAGGPEAEGAAGSWEGGEEEEEEEGGGGGGFPDQAFRTVIESRTDEAVIEGEEGDEWTDGDGWHAEPHGKDEGAPPHKRVCYDGVEGEGADERRNGEPTGKISSAYDVLFSASKGSVTAGASAATKKMKRGYYDPKNVNIASYIKTCSTASDSPPQLSKDTRYVGKKRKKDEQEVPPKPSDFKNNEDYVVEYLRFLAETKERLRLEKKSSFEGALVFPTVIKEISKDITITLDFVSLYPSIIIAYNAGHCRMSTKERLLRTGYTESEVNDPALFYRSPSKSLFPKTGEMDYMYFKQSVDASPEEFLLKGVPLDRLKNPDMFLVNRTKWVTETEAPNYCMHVEGKKEGGKVLVVTQLGDVSTYSQLKLMEVVLIEMRKQIKLEQLAHPPGSHQWCVLEARQLAVKLIANTIFGLASMGTGKLASTHIGPMITGTGQVTIVQALTRILDRFQGTRVLGGDTDSFFVNIPIIRTLDDVMKHYGKILETVNVFKDPIKMNFEKAMKSLLSTAKKRYAYMCYEPALDPVTNTMVMRPQGRLCYKGIELARRDNCSIVRITQKGFLERLMKDNDGPEAGLKKAMQFVRKTVDDLRAGAVNMSYLIETRQRSRATYASDTLPIITVDKFLKSIGEPGVEVGSRCKFITVVGKPGMKAYQRAMPPQHAIMRGMEPDYEHIIRQRLKLPILRLVPTNIISNAKADKIMFAITQNDVCKKRVLDETDPLSKHVVVLDKCRACGAPSAGVICDKCNTSGVVGDALSVAQGKLTAIQATLSNKEDVCMKCMSVQKGEDIVCDNYGCGDMFPRLNAIAAVTRQSQLINKLAQCMNDISINKTSSYS